MKKVILAVFVVIVLGGYLYLSKPDNIVINEKGSIEGLVNKFRALIQGKRFWNYQLGLATEKFNMIQAPQKPSSAEMQQLYKIMRDAQKALDDKMKVLFTAEEEEAIQLRIKADSLERSGKWKLIDDKAEAIRMRELENLKIIIPIIEDKLHIPKP